MHESYNNLACRKETERKQAFRQSLFPFLVIVSEEDQDENWNLSRIINFTYSLAFKVYLEYVYGIFSYT